MDSICSIALRTAETASLLIETSETFCEFSVSTQIYWSINNAQDRLISDSLEELVSPRSDSDQDDEDMMDDRRIFLCTSVYSRFLS